ncbi:hypothetical protein [Bartonella gliris]|uniref:hypothetical protein n=1 Tax=Bartonella gliris TaxID=3004109 RepID=UPI003872EA43
MKGKNLALDKAENPPAFEEAFLSSRDYKRIFCLSVTLVVLKCIFLAPILAEWKLTELEAGIVATFLLVLEMISLGLFLFIPVMLMLRILFGHLLKKNLQKLEEITWQRDEAMRIQVIGLEGDKSPER